MSKPKCPLCGKDMDAIETHPGRGELHCAECDLVIGGNEAKTPDELMAVLGRGTCEIGEVMSHRTDIERADMYRRQLGGTQAALNRSKQRVKDLEVLVRDMMELDQMRHLAFSWERVEKMQDMRGSVNARLVKMGFFEED